MTVSTLQASLEIAINEGGDQLYHTKIQLGDRAPIGVTIDTGSTGIVIGDSFLPGDARKISPQPPYHAGYSSSGIQYEGAWYEVDVTVQGDGGQAVMLNLPVFGASSTQNVFMMGIGMDRGDKPNSYSPFLNVSYMELESGKTLTDIYQGYVFRHDGITLGLTDALVAGFPNAAPAASFTANASLTPTKSSPQQAEPFAFTAQLLVDSGINYMILNPSLRHLQDAPAGYQGTNPPEFYPGADLAVTGPSVAYDFVTGPVPGNPAETPAYVRWGVSAAGSIINTGRHVLFSHDLLVDGRRGVFGLKETGG